jgi:hypothetical protein
MNNQMNQFNQIKFIKYRKLKIEGSFSKSRRSIIELLL